MSMLTLAPSGLRLGDAWSESRSTWSDLQPQAMLRRAMAIEAATVPLWRAIEEIRRRLNARETPARVGAAFEDAIFMMPPGQSYRDRIIAVNGFFQQSLQDGRLEENRGEINARLQDIQVSMNLSAAALRSAAIQAGTPTFAEQLYRAGKDTADGWASCLAEADGALAKLDCLGLKGVVIVGGLLLGGILLVQVLK